MIKSNFKIKNKDILCIPHTQHNNFILVALIVLKPTIVVIDLSEFISNKNIELLSSTY